MTFGKNFLPGPTGVHPDLLQAMVAPMFAHYGPRMRPFLEEIQPQLRAMFGTSQPVFTVTCSGTGLLEAAIRNAVRERVLVVVTGYFGEYWAQIAERCGKEVTRVHVPIGGTLEAAQLTAFLDGPAVDAVAVVHSESTSGALAPLAELAAAVRQRPNVHFLVDGVSSAGGVPIEMDRLGIDFMVTGSQKALGLPPGLAFGAVSRRLAERAASMDDAGFYFSVTRWVEMAANYRLAETPALPLFMALVAQLRRIEAAGGWAPRWERHRLLSARFSSWAAERGLDLLARPERRTPTVSVFRPPAGRAAAPIAAALEAQGFLVGQGISADQGQMIRIGHMGDIEVEHLDALLATLEPLIS